MKKNFDRTIGELKLTNVALTADIGVQSRSLMSSLAVTGEFEYRNAKGRFIIDQSGNIFVNSTVRNPNYDGNIPGSAMYMANMPVCMAAIDQLRSTIWAGWLEEIKELIATIPWCKEALSLDDQTHIDYGDISIDALTCCSYVWMEDAVKGWDGYEHLHEEPSPAPEIE